MGVRAEERHTQRGPKNARPFSGRTPGTFAGGRMGGDFCTWGPVQKCKLTVSQPEFPAPFFPAS